MSLALVGVGSAAPPSNVAVNVSLPGGSAAGHLCVAVYIGDLTSSSLPTGFTALNFQNTDTVVEIRSCTKILTGTDITNNFVTVSGDASFNGGRWQLWFLSDTSTPTIDTSTTNSAQDLSGGNSVAGITSVTTTQANDIVLIVAGGRVGAATAWSATPAGYTNDQNVGSVNQAIWSGHIAQAVAGATGSLTATLNTTFLRWATATIAVAPAVVATFTPTRNRVGRIAVFRSATR